MQEEISKLLSEPISKTSDSVRDRALKRFKTLASFMEKLTSETKHELKLELPAEPDIIASVHSSMIGEISPHHEVYGNETSSESPPTYNQLNYNENLWRFFNSKPLTNSTDEAMNIDGDNGVGESNSVLSPIQRFSTGGGYSGGSANNSSSDCYSLDSTSGGSNVQHQPLTENLLEKHNDEMKKMLLHKKAKIINRMGGILKKGPDRMFDHCNMQGHGVKRSGSHSGEEEAHKNSKYQHISDIRGKFDSIAASKTALVNDTYLSTNQQGRIYFNQETSQNLNTCVSLAKKQNPHAPSLNQFSTGCNSYFPAICYIPFSQTNTSSHGNYLRNTGPFTSHHYMNALMCPHPSFVSQPLSYTHPSVTYNPVTIPNLGLTTGITCQVPTNSSAFTVIIIL